MFSIIIPLYNKENYIENAVKSVLQQDYPHFELIIVDDGSTDASLERVNAFDDERLKVITQQNRGVSAARNRGVSLAYYDYIAFLDADDRWDKSFLSKMLRLITDFPEAGIYGCQYLWVKNGRQSASSNHEPPGFAGYFDYFRAYTYDWWMPLTSISVVIPAIVFREMSGFKVSLKFGEDLDLWLRIALKHKVAYLNEPLAYYNQDVETSGRALGMQKAWKREEHVIFNLNPFAEAEQRSPLVNTLLDGLRVRSLIGFYLNSQHKDVVDRILKQVDFDRQPFLYKFIYRWPKPLVAIYFRTKKLGSLIKQALLHKRRSIVIKS